MKSSITTHRHGCMKKSKRAEKGKWTSNEPLNWDIYIAFVDISWNYDCNIFFAFNAHPGQRGKWCKTLEAYISRKPNCSVNCNFRSKKNQKLLFELKLKQKFMMKRGILVNNIFFLLSFALLHQYRFLLLLLLLSTVINMI